MDQKKALLVISFGTSYKDTREKTIEEIASLLGRSFEDCDLFQAYTSKMIIRKIQRVEGIEIDTPLQAIQKILDQGYREVFIQPTHMIAGSEYGGILEELKDFLEKFDRVKIGRALLDSTQDYQTVAQILETIYAPKENQFVLLMGHGSAHSANTSYAALNYHLKMQALEKGQPSTIQIACVEGYPEYEDLLKEIEASKAHSVLLAPFMIVAGDHALNDMTGDDSWQTDLISRGYQVEAVLKGLGEYEPIRELYLAHMKEALENE